MFVDLTSLCIIGVEAAECRYDSASAVFAAILRRVSHDMVDAVLPDVCTRKASLLE